MGQDQDERNVGYLAVVLEHHVYAERGGDRLYAGNQGELEPHHGEPHEPEGDREVDYEPPPWFGPTPGEDERSDGDKQIYQYPERRTDRPLQLHLPH